MVSAGVSSLARASPGLTQRSSARLMNHSRSSEASSKNAGTLRKSAISASVRALSGCSVMRGSPLPSLETQTCAAGQSLHLSQILMHELHDDSALAYARRDALHRAMAYVTDHKNSRNIRFEQARVAVERPALRPLAIVQQTRPAPAQTAPVAHDPTLEPFGARLRADKDEQAGGRELFGFRGHPALNADFTDPHLPMYFNHPSLRP